MYKRSLALVVRHLLRLQLPPQLICHLLAARLLAIWAREKAATVASSSSSGPSLAPLVQHLPAEAAVVVSGELDECNLSSSALPQAEPGTEIPLGAPPQVRPEVPTAVDRVAAAVFAPGATFESAYLDEGRRRSPPSATNAPVENSPAEDPRKRLKTQNLKNVNVFRYRSTQLGNSPDVIWLPVLSPMLFMPEKTLKLFDRV